ncbi:hypothetical protein ABG79_01342 [Caloramator mitchellensis]|uniref:Prepilin-type N-terminal cleavage/methylation domain-containing protein n=1 Tax=Caloramator mitchellensis TaxID=908809 RepID=A0A0R3JTI8_CALMK|nr:hypothetical protein [Caloramator mitchellensis]KRQ86851.1 hypothetical protein ABG79_01342 [Caloramator mitchellensis]
MKKGYILIETLSALILFAFLLYFTLNFYLNQINILNLNNKKLDSNINKRIAIEFLAEKIKNASSIVLNGDVVYIDNKKIYLKNDVLIYDYGSVQIADGIKKFSVIYLGKGLYEVKVESLYSSNSVIVKNR